MAGAGVWEQYLPMSRDMLSGAKAEDVGQDKPARRSCREGPKAVMSLSPRPRSPDSTISADIRSYTEKRNKETETLLFSIVPR